MHCHGWINSIKKGMTMSPSPPRTENKPKKIGRLLLFGTQAWSIWWWNAEWQLVELESSRHIDGILTTDGDIFPLGAKTVYLDTRFGDKSITAFRFTRDLAMNHIKYDKRQTDRALYSMQWYRDYIPKLCALLGCDYIKRIKNCGPVTILTKVLPKYILNDDKASLSQFEMFWRDTWNLSSWQLTCINNHLCFGNLTMESLALYHWIHFHWISVKMSGGAR